MGNLEYYLLENICWIVFGTFGILLAREQTTNFFSDFACLLRDSPSSESKDLNEFAGLKTLVSLCSLGL